MPIVAATPGLDPGGGFPVELVFGGAVLLVAVAALAREHERPYSAAISYLVLGIAAALGIELLDLAWLNPFREAEVIEHIAVFALIVALFGSGLRLQRPFRRRWVTTAILLAVVMPLTVAAVAAFAVGAMGLSLGAAIILGAILAPTDPVLAGDIGLGPPGKEREEDARFHVTTEAGLNDSLIAPFVLLGIFVTEQQGVGWVGEWLATDVLYAVAVAVAAGAAGARALAVAATRLRERDLVRGELDIFLVLGGVVIVYGAVTAIDAYGLLAVFVAGVGFRQHEAERGYHRRIHDGIRVGENLLEIAVIFVLGSLVTTSALDDPGIAGWLLIPLLIVAIRPIGALTTLRPIVPRLRDRLFMAWFGVKGVASIYWAAVVLALGVIPEDEQAPIFWTIAFAVMVSIVVHGVSATPLARRLLG